MNNSNVNQVKHVTFISQK